MNSAIEFSVADFPGYQEAAAREIAIRGAACLGINETICGMEVRPLCAAHVRLLTLIQSPFLRSSLTDELAAKPEILGDIMRFLWIVSPHYERGSKASAPRRWWQLPASPTRRDMFNHAAAQLATMPALDVIEAIVEYVDEAFIDDDENETDSGTEKSHYAFEISVAHEMHKHYGYRVDFWDAQCPPEENSLLVPLKIFFQLRKLRAHIENAGGSPGNKSDRFVRAGLEAIGKRQVEKN